MCIFLPSRWWMDEKNTLNIVGGFVLTLTLGNEYTHNAVSFNTVNEISHDDGRVRTA